MSKEKKGNGSPIDSLDSLEGLKDLKFSISQVQDLTGIKKGSIQYWTDAGHIRGVDESENGKYYYTPGELRKIQLIDKFYNNGDQGGFALEVAAKKAEEFLNIKDSSGAEAELLIIQKHLEDRIDDLAEKFVKAGLADEIIEVLSEEDE